VNHLKLANVIQAPVVSEKSTILGDSQNRFVFKVLKTATKSEIKSAVELMFTVDVESVQVANVRGKSKRFGQLMGSRADWKKAYVRLKPGHDIDFSGA